MYGTVARLSLKPGVESRLQEMMKEDLQTAKIAGYVETRIYRMDSNPNELWMAVTFDDKKSYVDNANSPEQDVRYRELRELLTEDPEWHDGEIVWAG